MTNDSNILSGELKKVVDRITYYAPSRYISGSITEYDMKSANINVLMELNKLTESEYDNLSYVPKQFREEYIGRKCKYDKELYKSMQASIKKYRELLVAVNNIQLNEIVRIANDAIYINRTLPLKITHFDNYIEFRPKNTYRSLLNLSSFFKVLFKVDSNGNMDIDVLDLGDNAIQLHQNYMLSFITTIINNIEHGYIVDALNMISSFYIDYINMRLPIQFYMEINSTSMYRIKYSGFCTIAPPPIEMIDISYNLKVIQELWSIVLDLYQN